MHLLRLSQPDWRDCPLPPPVRAPSIHFRTCIVSRLLPDRYIYKLPGLDGISAIVLKRCSSTLTKPQRKLFICITRQHSFREDRLQHLEQAVLKKSEFSSCNCRPIVLMCLFSTKRNADKLSANAIS